MRDEIQVYIDILKLIPQTVDTTVELQIDPTSYQNTVQLLEQLERTRNAKVNVTTTQTTVNGRDAGAPAPEQFFSHTGSLFAKGDTKQVRPGQDQMFTAHTAGRMESLEKANAARTGPAGPTYVFNFDGAVFNGEPSQGFAAVIRSSPESDSFRADSRASAGRNATSASS